MIQSSQAGKQLSNIFDMQSCVRRANKNFKSSFQVTYHSIDRLREKTTLSLSSTRFLLSDWKRIRLPQEINRTEIETCRCLDNLNSTEVLAKVRDCIPLNYQKVLRTVQRLLYVVARQKNQAVILQMRCLKTLKVFNLPLLFYVCCS